MASVEPTIASIVAATNSSKSAWDALHTTYANRSQTRVFILHDQLARTTKDSHSITEYLHTIRSLSDELATAGSPVSNPELIVKILSGLGPEFREISAAIRARNTAVFYEELFEKLLDHELFLRHEDAKKLSDPITAAVATPTKSNANNRNIARRTTLPNNGTRIHIQTLHSGSLTQIEDLSLDVNFAIGLAAPPMSAAQNHIITLRQNPTMRPDLLLPPVPG
ncbi:uncharacterized protein LOC107873781 [Capsicum annuum]|uniref:uncharacterized protein LOC107873781 n=1 Tax=Capsicum annuum TaxID=4072 RepID=UPI0007BFB90B|nr:uncharacterized protein LOC107873781 [Capsicum annuum]